VEITDKNQLRSAELCSFLKPTKFSEKNHVYKTLQLLVMRPPKNITHS